MAGATNKLCVVSFFITIVRETKKSFATQKLFDEVFGIGRAFADPGGLDHLSIDISAIGRR